MGKTVLIVFAHLEDTSFNGALRDAAIETLTNQGHKVIVSDLYKMNYNPVISKNDIKGEPKNREHFNYSEEAALAWAEGRIADDIRAEQEKVTAAELIIFQFPLHWMGMPAILKGWCDRTFLAAYAFSETELYDNGKLKGKRAILSLTTGAPHHFYTTEGPNGDVNVLLWPLQNGILRMLGFDVLPPFITYSPQLETDDRRSQILSSWRQRLQHIFTDKPLYFVPISKFYEAGNEDKRLKLTDAVVREEQVDEHSGLTVGQHLNRKLPQKSMTHPRS